MNIYEALKTGKPYRRPSWRQWSDQAESGCLLQFFPEDLKATDWEVQNDRCYDKLTDHLAALCGHLSKDGIGDAITEIMLSAEAYRHYSKLKDHRYHAVYFQGPTQRIRMRET